MVASFYHPVANKRLEELREGRKGGTESSTAAGPNPEEMSKSTGNPVSMMNQAGELILIALFRSESSCGF